MAELLSRDGRYLAMANDKQVGGPFATIEEAVAAVPALRMLAAPADWTLTTSLTNGAAGFMLDEPAEGVDEVEVNGVTWIATTTRDSWGRQIGDFPVTRLEFPSGRASSIARDRSGRATSGAGFSEGDISLIVSAVNAQFGGIVSVNDTMWLEGHPAPHGLQRSRSGRPARLTVQGVETVQIPTGSWNGHPLSRSETRAFWSSGVLTDVALNDSHEASWFAVVSRDPNVGSRVLAANFTRSNDYGEEGILFGVVLEVRGSKPYLGFLLDDLEAALLYAGAFGGVVITGDDATLVEASADGSAVRAWSWRSERVDPPAVANDLPSIDDFGRGEFGGVY